MVKINLRVLAELGRSVARAGGRLVIADVDTYFAFGAPTVSERLRALCEREGFDYVDAGQALKRAARRQRIHWERDWHFNAHGNEALAIGLERPLRRSLRSHRHPASAAETRATRPPPTGSGSIALRPRNGEVGSK